MRSCVAGRLPSVPLLLLLVLFLGALAPTKAADEDRFLTNLALLDAMAADAVDQILDSLGVAADDSIAVLANGYNEGNGFIADAFARSLARRGCSVRMVAEAAAAAPEPPAPAGGTAPAEADTADGGPDESDDQPDQDEVDQTDDIDSDPFDDLDPFAEDSTAVGDSTFWGTDEDTLSADEGEAGEDTDEKPDEDDERKGIPPEPPQVAAERVYPPGAVLEFQVLEFGVTYPDVKRRFVLLGTSSVSRLAGVYVQARRIEGPEGEILQVVSGQSHHRDRLSGRSRVLAEGAGYPFEAPTVPPGRIKKLAEPMMVLGIIGSLVYLFYQNQN